MKKNKPNDNFDASNNTEETFSLDDLLNKFVSNQDEDAFEKLFAEIGERLFSFIFRYIGNTAQAEDVYQEVCLKVAMKANTYSHKANVASWIFQIARNTSIDAIRSKGRRPTVSIDGNASQAETTIIELVNDNEINPAEKAAQIELATNIARAIDKLPNEQREVFLLREDGGLTFEEISKIVSCGKETVKSRMRYALERLRNSLGKEAQNYGLH